MTDPAPLASELRLAVHRLTRKLRAQRPVDGLSLTQLSALVSIWREGPLSAGELAALEGVKPPSATRVLAALESQELVVRTIDPADGRQIQVSITSAGVGRIQADLAARDAWLARQLEGLSARDRDLLRRAAALLERLAGQ